MENDLKFSRKRYHFGIHLGAGLGDFKIRHNALFGSSDSILTIKSKFKTVCLHFLFKIIDFII